MSQQNQNQTPTNPESDEQSRAATDTTDIQTSGKGAKATSRDSDVAPTGTLRSFFNLELFFDFLLIVVTAVYAFFAYSQWKAIERQADLMSAQLASLKDSSAQTERLIAANEELARQNAGLVKHAGEQAQASLMQAEAAKQSVAAAEQSARASERGAQIAQQSFYIGDRPYVTANAILDDFEAGMAPTIDILFVNAGKTPALDLQVGAIVNLETLPEPDVKKYRQMSETEMIASQKDSLPYGAFMPGGSKIVLAADAKLLAQIRAPLMTPALVDDINTRKKFLFVWGAAIYNDGLRRPHKLRFCLFYDPKQDMFIACPTYNSTN